MLKLHPHAPKRKHDPAENSRGAPLPNSSRCGITPFAGRSGLRLRMYGLAGLPSATRGAPGSGDASRLRQNRHKTTCHECQEIR